MPFLCGLFPRLLIGILKNSVMIGIGKNLCSVVALKVTLSFYFIFAADFSSIHRLSLQAQSRHCRGTTQVSSYTLVDFGPIVVVKDIYLK